MFRPVRREGSRRHEHARARTDAVRRRASSFGEVQLSQRLRPRERLRARHHRRGGRVRDVPTRSRRAGGTPDDEIERPGDEVPSAGDVVAGGVRHGVEIDGPSGARAHDAQVAQNLSLAEHRESLRALHSLAHHAPFAALQVAAHGAKHSLPGSDANRAREMPEVHHRRASRQRERRRHRRRVPVLRPGPRRVFRAEGRDGGRVGGGGGGVRRGRGFGRRNEIAIVDDSFPAAAASAGDAIRVPVKHHVVRDSREG